MYMDEQNQQSWLEENKTVLMILGVFVIITLVIILIFIAIRIIGQPKTPASAPVSAPVVASSTPVSSTSVLPIGVAQTDNSTTSIDLAEQQAQKSSFGDFYHPTSTPIFVSSTNFSLPQNVKTDVANYYDVNRKLSLDAGLNSLNSNGFTILDNPFGADADNFFSMYSALDSKQVPAMITSDFLIYYYQNTLKIAYQNLESSVFYDNLWTADQRLYQLAKQRYENYLHDQGTVNDVALEASRLELAYFATALSLLATTDGQISSQSGLSDGAGFSTAEASQYSIQLPAYLQNDVGAEVSLIRGGSGVVKSPVLLFPRDYSTFAVPTAYKDNARLNNFYLASKWLNSVFPLYYRSAACPNCLLDVDDWRINFSAAFLISADLGADRNLQNRWAKIYKLQSFFSGLRGDLNYLYYEQVFKAAFADKSDITEILQGEPADNDKNLSLLQDKLAAIDFSALVGGFSKTDAFTKPQLGFKMLTDFYWPDNYIFGQLTYPAVGKFLGSTQAAGQVATACRIPGLDEFDRCAGSAYDILNLIHPLSTSSNNYFSGNSNYAGYFSQAGALQKMLGNFNVDSWHASAYWANLDIGGKFLRAPEIGKITVMKSAAWQNKNLNTVLAAWANEELPADIFSPYQVRGSIGLGSLNGGNIYPLYSYIEPNLTLDRELIFNTQMIIQMLSLLNVSDGENTVISDLKAMQKNLSDVETIMAEELRGQDLSDEDSAMISGLTHAFSVSAAGAKKFYITPLPAGSQLSENLSGIKLLIYSFARGGQKFFAVGPIFNWQEER
jgi:hypothetical protein